MNYANIKSCDIANGPGVRVSLFVSGCTHHCKDCFNEEAWDFSYGEPFTDEVSDRLLAMLCPDYIRGITYLGGEPFDPHNQESLLLLSRRIRQELPEKSIWAFTGYVYGGNLPMPMICIAEPSAFCALEPSVWALKISCALYHLSTHAVSMP